ncbi:hypothetical protein mRhiFer1_009287 [Rhinolophus ferrumequinum]|uniref:Uncharacterized protein n=1 Tax=Rhinolophus ferrumequinum TaxID=59479 RepID=A0A7J7RYC2_RHIFE|nr:hypothetical protein mRhiFer1_009287 [Rhinolophus ferrumequinum]
MVVAAIQGFARRGLIGCLSASCSQEKVTSRASREELGAPGAAPRAWPRPPTSPGARLLERAVATPKQTRAAFSSPLNPPSKQSSDSFPLPQQRGWVGWAGEKAVFLAPACRSLPEMRCQVVTD